MRSRYTPLPTGVAQPHDWGRPDYVRALLAEGFEDVRLQESWFPIVAGSAEEARGRWLSSVGPMRQAYATLSGPDREALSADLLELFASSKSRASAWSCPGRRRW